MTNWKYFEIGKLFHQIYKASAYNAQDLISSSAVNSDAIRYITRTDTNNGCKEFVQNENFTQIEQGNAITMYLANLHTSFLCNLIYPTFSRILLYSC